MRLENPTREKKDLGSSNIEILGPKCNILNGDYTGLKAGGTKLLQMWMGGKITKTEL